MYIILFCSLLAALETDPFSGETRVDGLGTIAFPNGDWQLEIRLKPSEDEYGRDTFVFKRIDAGLERLAFRGLGRTHRRRLPRDEPNDLPAAPRFHSRLF